MSDAFELKTLLAIQALMDDAAKVRRNLPNDRHACPDSGRCNLCERLHQIHLCLDDHCEQLDEYRASLRHLEPA